MLRATCHACWLGNLCFGATCPACCMGNVLSSHYTGVVIFNIFICLF